MCIIKYVMHYAHIMDKMFTKTTQKLSKNAHNTSKKDANVYR